MASHGGRRPGAGRKPGRVSAIKRELAEMAKEHASTALEQLVEIVKGGESESARVSAAIAILDRGYGRPFQAVQMSGPGGGPIPTMVLDPEKLKTLSDSELSALELAIGKLAGRHGEVSQGGDSAGTDADEYARSIGAIE